MSIRIVRHGEVKGLNQLGEVHHRILLYRSIVLLCMLTLLDQSDLKHSKTQISLFL